ncbi:hypothetical protein MRB53_037357 [Persea americana]|nr:hypothetical protein MRB53_037357 [Persea americana]
MVSSLCRYSRYAAVQEACAKVMHDRERLRRFRALRRRRRETREKKTWTAVLKDQLRGGCCRCCVLYARRRPGSGMLACLSTSLEDASGLWRMRSGKVHSWYKC